ncbi:hypothetical protein Tco_1478192 [Tanacetum coccineum]
MLNPQEFFLLEGLLPLKKRGCLSSSTSALPQDFEIGETIKQNSNKLVIKFLKLQKKQMGNNHKISLDHFRITDLEHIINDIQIRHQEDKEGLLNAINELKISQEGPPDY